MGMAAFFATKKAKELAAIAQHPLPVELSPTVSAALEAIEATDTSAAGAPCPNCGRPLSKQGRHLHIRRCIVP